MYLSNGTPDLRILIVGTKLILGVSNQNVGDDTVDVGVDDLPSSIQRAWRQPDFDHDLYGDFTVCAWTRQRPGEMQFVKVRSGSNLVPTNPSQGLR